MIFTSLLLPIILSHPTHHATAKIKIKNIVVGKGPAAKSGDKVTVHYTGSLTNGKVFDSSIPKKEPFTFTIDGHEVIKGWDIGVTGMKVGGKRKLTIPSDLAYGDAGRPPVIPPKATLIFVVQLLKIEKP